MSDPGTTYRTREEIQQMRSTRDAITGIKTYLTEWGIADDAKLKAIDKAAKAEVDAAVDQAKKDSFPDLDAFWTDVYVSGVCPLEWILMSVTDRYLPSGFVYSTRVPSRRLLVAE
jgi:pyruvate dehydrogenase E1 component alpha subunit